LTGVVDPELSNVLSNGGAIVPSKFTHQMDPVNAGDSSQLDRRNSLRYLVLNDFANITEHARALLVCSSRLHLAVITSNLQNDGFDDERTGVRLGFRNSA